MHSSAMRGIQRFALTVTLCLIWALPSLRAADGSKGSSKSPSEEAAKPAPAKTATAPKPAGSTTTSGNGATVPSGNSAKPTRPPNRMLNPPVNARRVPLKGGATSITSQDGRKWVVGSNGKVTSFSKPGMEAKFGRDGQATLVRDTNRNVYLLRSGDGVRTVVRPLPGGVNVVSFGGAQGFVERPLRPGFVQRTVLMNGEERVNVYQVGNYRGIAYYRYVPDVTFQPKFYQWTATSWPSPVTYTWGWRGQPWFAFDSSYFAPDATYSSPTAWLADYAVASTLRDGYNQMLASGTAVQSPPDEAVTPISPQLKQAIADEIAAQLRRDGADGHASETSDGAPSVLDPKTQVFVVSTSLQVNAGGATCSLTAGDFITRTSDQIGEGKTIAVKVSSSKAGDCPVNTSASLQIGAVQEMANVLHQKVIAGVGVMAKNEGQGGFPTGPAANPTSSPDGYGQPDSMASALLAQAELTANQSEIDAKAGAASGG